MSADDFKTLRDAVLSWAAYAKDAESAASVAALVRIEAGAAAMREALERYGHHLHSAKPSCQAAVYLDEAANCVCGLSAALATNAGAGLLAEVRNLRTHNEELGRGMHNARQYANEQRERAEKAEAEVVKLRTRTLELAGELGATRKARTKAEAEREALRGQSAATASRNKDLMIQVASYEQQMAELRTEVERLNRNPATTTDDFLAIQKALVQARREERERCASAAWLWWRDRDPDCDDGDSLRDALRALGDAPA